MLIFKVIERLVTIGDRKGQKAYVATPKAQQRFSMSWLIARIVRETSLSEGDVRNVLVTLRNIIVEVVTLGGALDLGDLFSLRVSIPSKMEKKPEDVSSSSLKKAGIIVYWKSAVSNALKNIETHVDNPARKKKKEKGGTPPKP